jgi:hypothetical protein
LEAALLEPAAGQGTSLGADEQAALVLAEKLYPTLLTQGGALGSAQGYVYRYYAGSGVYVGFRNQRIYLLGGPFGNVAQDKGTVASVLSSLRIAEARIQSLQANEPVPVLYNLGIESLDSIQFDQNALREFAQFGLKGFYIFGDALSGGRRNPNFEYSSLKEGTRVVSAIDGVVVNIERQAESNDFEVFIQPKDGSAWTLAYDHLVNVTLQRGDVVKVGTVLGNPARQNNGLLRFELQINQDIGPDGPTRKSMHFCPTLLLDVSVRDQLTAALTTMMNGWETFSGLELYDPSRHTPVGCTKPMMTPEEAQGSNG